ncbi:MAG TPA: DNA methyltransferase [Polyangiaceae bacterium]|nr:DNA methyltransferase [Polyangiaceae bacterium]
MSDADKRFHEQWLGMAQPAEGLVVSLPVLVEAQCMEKLPREVHARFLQELVQDPDDRLRIGSLRNVLTSVLELGPERFDDEGTLPRELQLYVPEGRQTLRPTRALKWPKAPDVKSLAAEATPASNAARPYAMLIWELSAEVLSLDKPETVTGAWEYPVQAKFERLLRECRVPIGLLSNGYEARLVYAPHGESSGWLSFRVNDMASVSGRPIFDAFVMLMSRTRWFGVAPEQQLPAILAASRKRNADVTNALSGQVFEALETLLAGFSASDERDAKSLLRAAIERGDEHLYAGLLSVLLRLVFLLYCEDRALLPVEHPVFSANYSLIGLFEQLQADFGKYPDTMQRRFGAYPRIVSLFRAVFLGVKHHDLDIPSRRGDLFDPNEYPFLEGWGPDGCAPINEPEARAAVQVPSVDDLTIYTVLDKLLYLDGQRLSYKALDVEQIGSVYEALMGFDVERLESPAVRIRLGSKKGAARVWLQTEKLLTTQKAQRERWLQDEYGFDKGVAQKIAAAVASASNAVDALTALEPLSGRRPERADAKTLVIQPGPERRRTSSHYTPRELTEPIVARTLEPLIRAMGNEPASTTLLNLVVCDPAMGSGAFLVAACRYLADHVVAAWTREGRMEVIGDAHDDVVNHARRLVAQRCLYGVDKNKYAVQLARLSLWLVTMARNEPFTFVDHALRHGDSLVGLNFDQIKAFHWKPAEQVELSATLLNEALDEAIGIRQRIQALAEEGTFAAQREKERLLFDAEDALGRVRLVGDLVIGAFFSQAKDKDREKERNRRLALVEQWLAAERSGDAEKAGGLLSDLRELQADLKRTQVPFHWMLEFPEVFYAERPDPLDGGRANGAAFVEAFVGNPPFLGGMRISGSLGASFASWLWQLTPEDGSGNADLSVYFLRRCQSYLGKHGTLGLIATNTVAQGDSRVVGLKHLVRSGGTIAYANRSLTWPGDAAVSVAVVVVRFGKARDLGSGFVLDGQSVVHINSRLRPTAERADPSQLATNQKIAFFGVTLHGEGFVLEPEEAARLLARDGRYADVLLSYIGGEDVNTDPMQAPNRFVINFGLRSLAEAAKYADLLRIVEERVKPGRQRLRQDSPAGRARSEYWWRFAGTADELMSSVRSLGRCLVSAQVTKHLCFSFQSVPCVFDKKLCVWTLNSDTAFAVLQSRVHAAWAWLLSSTMKSDLNYSASDCFETFPFPQPDPRSVIPELEMAGKALNEARAQFMVGTSQGLTKTYNALKDSSCSDSRVVALRACHEATDRAVLAAYGWTDILVPPYCPLTEHDKAAVRVFEDELVDRLFLLNSQRSVVAHPSSRNASSREGRAPKAVGSGQTKAAAGEHPQRALPGLDADDG